MIKRAAFYCLHYGKEYLAWSIRSVQEAVDEIIVVYSDKPSFGHFSGLACPDTEEQLKDEANRFLKRPLIWHKGTWGQEGMHRREIYRIAEERKIDQVLVVDADELWHPEDAAKALDLPPSRPERNVLVRFVHFWRSFNWTCPDPAMPVRICNVKGTPTDWFLPPQTRPVLHFGYAQAFETIDYKMSIHGHKNELREGWAEHKYKAWKPESGIKDVHPTNIDFWAPQATSPLLKEAVDTLLKDHPYYGKDTIQ